MKLPKDALEMRIGDRFVGAIHQLRLSKKCLYTRDFVPAFPFEADADTLALYRFDEGHGDVLHDRSGNARDARIVGAKWKGP